MGFFSANGNSDIKAGNRVKVNYAGIEGTVVNVSGNQVMISYQNEEDHEVVETYNIDDVDVV